MVPVAFTVFALGGLGSLLPASAHAGINARYAAPDGLATSPCTMSEPCDLRTAVDGAGDADGVPDVLLEPGTYPVAGSLLIDDGTSVAPIDPEAPTPTIQVSGNERVALSSTRATSTGSSLRDVRVEGGFGLVVSGQDLSRSSVGAPPVVERVEVSTNNGRTACVLYGAIVRNSECRTDGPNTAIRADTSAGAEYETVLRNVTASSSESYGLVATAEPDSSLELRARNVIASSESETSAEVRAEATSAGASVTADIDYSNFGSVDVFELDGGEVEAPEPDSLSNQTAEPLFVDEAAGDLRQAAGSPTIDAGTAEGTAPGEIDLDRQDRVQGSEIDIGAFEAFADTTKPEVRIIRSPAKRTRSRVAAFRFTGADDSPDETVRFSCRLDGKPAKPCSSPKTYRDLKPGRHTFSLTGTDDAGNSATKRYAWTVVKKKRRS